MEIKPGEIEYHKDYQIFIATKEIWSKWKLHIAESNLIIPSKKDPSLWNRFWTRIFFYPAFQWKYEDK